MSVITFHNNMLNHTGQVPKAQLGRNVCDDGCQANALLHVASGPRAAPYRRYMRVYQESAVELPMLDGLIFL